MEKKTDPEEAHGLVADITINLIHHTNTVL